MSDILTQAEVEQALDAIEMMDSIIARDEAWLAWNSGPVDGSTARHAAYIEAKERADTLMGIYVGRYRP